MLSVFHSQNMAHVVIILLTFLSLVHEASAACQRYWTQVDGDCYLLIPYHTSWTDSESYCTAVGGHLPSLQTEAKYTSMKRYLNSFSTTWNVWVGGIDVEHTGHWLWANTREYFTYTDWTYPLTGDCLFLNKDSQYMWSMASCSNTKLAFVCIKDTI